VYKRTQQFDVLDEWVTVLLTFQAGIDNSTNQRHHTKCQWLCLWEINIILPCTII